MSDRSLFIKRSALLAFAVVSVSSLFYVYEFFLRVVPSVLNHELMRDFHMDAAGLGVISAFFFYGYTPMQIPAGLLADRFGPRRVLTWAVLICAAAIWMFSATHSMFLLSASRFMIGVASAAAFIAPLMLASRWYAPEKFVVITGLIQMMGCVGAIVAGAPVAMMSAHWGWRATLEYSALAGLVLAVLFALVIRDHPKDCPQEAHNEENPMTEMERLKAVCHSAQNWWVALVGFACWVPVVVFAALWGIPFLTQVYHTDATQASSMTLWVWVGVSLGGPLIGWWTDKVRSRKQPLIINLVLAIVCMSLVILWHPMPIWLLDALLFLVGVSASVMAVTFGIVRDINPASVVGTAVGFNNMAVIAGGSSILPLVGVMLNHFWGGQMQAGVPLYSVDAYTWALMSIPVCSLIGLLIVLFKVKESAR